MEPRKSQALSEEFFRSLAENASDILFVMDEVGTFTYASASAETYLGFKPEELVGTNAFKLISRPDLPRALKDFRASMATKKATLLNSFRVKHKNGSLRVLEGVGKNLSDDLSVGGFVMSVRDVTEIKETEQELKRLAVELEKAKDAAIREARVKAEFLANISHEIRTPMNAVLGLTEAMLDTSLSPQQKDYALKIQGAGEVLMALINDVLDFSKLESGKLALESIEFDLEGLLRDTLELLVFKARSRKLDLAASLDPSVPTRVRGDPGRIRQVLLNLIGNSIKFTEKGGVSIVVSTAAESAETTRVRFEVADTGIGIPEEARSILFKPFSQADASTTRRFGGTGLGLAICKNLVEAMGGTIGFGSRPTGTMFHFELPLKRASGATRRLPPPELSKLKVLYVDDNAVSSAVLARQLQSWGMACCGAVTAEEGLGLLRKASEEGSPFDLAIIDYRLPDKDGLELAREARAEAALKRTRMLLISGMDLELERAALKEAGVSRVLQKPIRSSSLLDAIAGTMAGTAESPSISITPAAPAASARERPLRRGFKLLLVEDNPVNQQVALVQLRRLGYLADTALNGKEALEALGRGRYDAVLMDCHMPEMDGYQATQELRKREGTGRRTPVIAMTADALSGDREKCLAAGMDDYMSKPIRREVLAATLRRWDPPLDPEAVRDLRDLGRTNPTFLRAVFGQFESDLPERVRALKKAAEDADAKAVVEIAHALKGSSGEIGGRRVQDLAAQIEEAGKAGDAALAATMLDALDEELGLLREAVSALLES